MDVRPYFGPGALELWCVRAVMYVAAVRLQAVLHFSVYFGRFILNFNRISTSFSRCVRRKTKASDLM